VYLLEEQSVRVLASPSLKWKKYYLSLKMNKKITFTIYLFSVNDCCMVMYQLNIDVMLLAEKKRHLAGENTSHRKMTKMHISVSQSHC